MNRSELLNGGAYSRTAFQAINKTATAASTGDATEVNCDWIDRMDDDFGLAMSAKLVITYTATLTGDATLSFAANFQDASDIAGGDAADYGALITATVVATGDSGGGGTVKDTVEIDVDLAGAKEFIRSQITPDLSAGSADTLEWSAALVFYGSGRQPSSKAIATVGGPV